MSSEKEILRKQKEEQAKLRKESEEYDLKQSIKETAKSISSMIDDKRYIGYKKLLETALMSYRNDRDTLRTKTTDEYVLLGIALDNKIELLDWILNQPERFIEASIKIREGEKANDGKHES